MSGKFLTSDEEERTSLELSTMLVLADKIWGVDNRFLDGHEIADVVNGIIVDAFGLKLFTLDGNVLGQGVLRFAFLYLLLNPYICSVGMTFTSYFITNYCSSQLYWISLSSSSSWVLVSVLAVLSFFLSSLIH